MKKIVLLTLVTLFFCCLSADDYHFAVLGDRTGGANQLEFEKVLKDIQALRPDFIVTVGDLTENGAVLKDWKKPMESLDLFDCKIYFTPGNHDLSSEESEIIFKEQTGFNRYYSFNRENSHFIILDNSRASNYSAIDKEQIEWLKKDLKKNKSYENIFVFMHKPFWANKIAQGKKDFIHDLFLENNVDAVFTGHWHQYAYNNFDGIDYYLAGSSGGGMPKENTNMGIFYQFLWCKVESDRLYTSLIKSGNIFEKDHVNIQEEQMSFKINSELITIDYPQKSEDSNSIPVDISIKNSTEKILDENLLISKSDNWKTDQETIPIKIKPGETIKRSILFEKQSSFFPLPELSYEYNFGREKYIEYTKKLFFPRTFQLKNAKQLPKVDGKITEKEISEAICLDEFSTSTGKRTNLKNSKLYFSKNNDSLYIAAICEKNTKNLKAEITERDKNVFSDDCIGFLLSQDKNSVFQFYINSLGNIMDMKSTLDKNQHNKLWNGDFKIAASVSQNHWTAELKIPLSDLEITKKTKRLYFNYRQINVNTGKEAYFSPEWRFDSLKSGIIDFQ